MSNQTERCIHSLTQIIFRCNADFEERLKRFIESFGEEKTKHSFDFIKNGLSAHLLNKFKLKEEGAVTQFQRSFLGLPLERRELVLRVTLWIAKRVIERKEQLGGVFPPFPPILSEAMKQTRPGWEKNLTLVPKLKSEINLTNTEPVLEEL